MVPKTKRARETVPKTKRARETVPKAKVGTQNGAKDEAKPRQKHADVNARKEETKRVKGEANGMCVRTNTV